jgi:hypothetical protein
MRLSPHPVPDSHGDLHATRHHYVITGPDVELGVVYVIILKSGLAAAEQHISTVAMMLPDVEP